MVLFALTASFIVALISASFTTILALYRLRGHAFATFLMLSTDFGLVILLPFALVSAVSLGVVVADRLFLSSILFYLAVLVCQLMFPTLSERLSHPITTVYLFFVVVLLLSTSLDGGLELGLVIFAYKLSDNITLAAVICLFVSAIAPPSKKVSLKLNDLVNLRRLENIRRGFSFSVTKTTDIPTSQAAETTGNALQKHPLRHCLKLLKEGEYESCVECCDMEVERFIASKLFQHYPAKLNAPLTLEEQLSKLSSKGISLDEESIKRLRGLRNTTTISSGQVTYHQAKWAIHVLRAIVKPHSKLSESTLAQ